ncbi:MAG: YkvA family protein [Chloroflexota bacterium]
MLWRSFRLLNLARGWRELLLNARLTWRLLADPRVPLTKKLVVPATILYILWPLDFLPDLLPFLGQVDDLTAILLAASFLQRISPAALVAEHRNNLLGRRRPSTGARDGTVIEGRYRVVDKEQR